MAASALVFMWAAIESKKTREALERVEKILKEFEGRYSPAAGTAKSSADSETGATAPGSEQPEPAASEG
jgi:hypothetical protein